MIDNYLPIMEAQSLIEMQDKEAWNVNNEFVTQFDTFTSLNKTACYIDSYFRDNKNSPTDFTNNLLAIL